MLALDKGNFHASRQESNSRPSGSVLGTSDKHVVFGGAWVQFSPGVRKFSLSRASVISPPSKLKMFTGSVCVLLTSVSLKLIKIKLIYVTTSSWEKNKMACESYVIPTDFIFLFIIQIVFSLWSELIRVQFYFSFLVDPSWSESIRVDPTRTGGPSWSDPTFVPAFFWAVSLKVHACFDGPEY